MKSNLFCGLLLGVGIVFSPAFIHASDALRYVPVAIEMNEKAGQRAYVILSAQKIESAAVGSLGNMEISVRSDRAAEARQLLANAIKTEKLDIVLLVRKGGKYFGATPEEIQAL